MGLRRAAILGGTFDPVHNGHLEAARRVQHLFAIERTVFVPACVPPHKRNANISSAFHRFAMLALATASDATFEISTVELEHPDQPYAVETVARLQAEFGSVWRLFFVMGSDSWAELASWHDWQRLLTICSPIVVTRPGHELSKSWKAVGTIISDVRGQAATEIIAAVDTSESPRTFITDAAMTDVSATAIRQAVGEGSYNRLRTMVPQSVADYIEKYGLYRR